MSPGAPVLLVDDEPAVRESLAELLELQGYSVVEAGDGRAALDLLHEGLTPCVILLDLWMPQMDGVAFLEQRQREPELAQIPVVVVSALGDAEKRTAGLDVQGHLAKPVPLPRLYTLLERCAGSPS